MPSTKQQQRELLRCLYELTDGDPMNWIPLSEAGGELSWGRELTRTVFDRLWHVDGLAMQEGMGDWDASVHLTVEGIHAAEALIGEDGEPRDNGDDSIDAAAYSTRHDCLLAMVAQHTIQGHTLASVSDLASHRWARRFAPGEVESTLQELQELGLAILGAAGETTVTAHGRDYLDALVKYGGLPATLDQATQGPGWRVYGRAEFACRGLASFVADCRRFGRQSVDYAILERTFLLFDDKVNSFLGPLGLTERYRVSVTVPEFSSIARENADSRETMLARIMGEVLRDGLPEAATSDEEVTVVEQRYERNTVFLVHGRDEAARNSVHLFLVDSLGLQVEVLASHPGRGRSLMRKFEDVAKNIGYAVVLLTGDDVGCLTGDEPDSLAPRARQNVILELGYFRGKLGADGVCALYEAGVVMPSDYGGISYVEYGDDADWKRDLVRELADVPHLDIDVDRYVRR